MVVPFSGSVRPIKQKLKKKKKENLSLISSIMLRKLRLMQKNDFLIKKRVLKI